MTRCWLASALGLSLMIACGGTQKPSAEAPAAPVPPTAPLAWMPEASTFLGRIVLAPFRDTPAWELWRNFERQQAVFAGWIDTALVDEITLGGSGLESEHPSFVAVLKGRFGEGYLERLAQTQALAPASHGLLARVYKRPEAAWVQLTPELLLLASNDQVEWLGARASQGPGEPIRNTTLYRSLSEQVRFEQAALALMIDDPEGKGRARFERDAKQFGVGLPDDIVRAGASLAMGPQVALKAIVESSTPEGAQSIQRVVDRSLKSLANNMFVGLFGLRPLVTALTADAQGALVSIQGSVSQEDLFALLGKLQSILEMAAAQRAPSAGS